MNDIKEFDDVIQIMEVPQLGKIEDLQLGEDPEVKSSLIIYQIDHQAENPEADPHKIDKQVKDEDLK